jgi:hypothetical protein
VVGGDAGAPALMLSPLALAAIKRQNALPSDNGRVAFQTQASRNRPLAMYSARR